MASKIWQVYYSPPTTMVHSCVLWFGEYSTAYFKTTSNARNFLREILVDLTRIKWRPWSKHMNIENIGRTFLHSLMYPRGSFSFEKKRAFALNSQKSSVTDQLLNSLHKKSLTKGISMIRGKLAFRILNKSKVFQKWFQSAQLFDHFISKLPLSTSKSK